MSNRLLGKIKENGAGLLFFFVCMFLLYVDTFEGFWDHDSGYYFLQSFLITKGFKPFLDYTTLYPPGFALINAIPVLLGLPKYFITWCIPLVWAGAIGLVTGKCWRLAYPAQSKLFSWFVAGLFPLYCLDFGGNHNTLELGITLFGLLALAAFLKNGDRRFFLAGLCIGYALLVKQIGLLLIFPFLTQCENRRNFTQLLSGFFLPIFLCLSWLHFDLKKIQISMVTLHQYIMTTAPSDLDSLLQAAINLTEFEIRRSPPGFFFVVGVVVLALFALGSHIYSKSLRPALWLSAWLMVGGAYLSARLVNNFPHYTLNCWTAWVALLCSSAVYLRPKIRNTILAGSLAGMFAVFLFSADGQIQDIRGKPYFTRWTGPNLLGGFLLPLSEEMNRMIPEAASITPLGAEESILLFLMGRVPLNKDWAPYNLWYSTFGDAIIFTDYGQSDAEAHRTEILKNGFSMKKYWPAKGRWVTLYLR